MIDFQWMHLVIHDVIMNLQYDAINYYYLIKIPLIGTLIVGWNKAIV